MMSRHLNVALFAVGLGLLIYMSVGDVFPQEERANATGEPMENASLVSTSPPPNSDSVHEADETGEGDVRLAKLHNDRGISYSEKGEYDLAISEFNKALEICPMLAQSYNNRGITYSKRGQYDLAISDFTKALEIEPDMAKVHYNRGITYAKQGQHALALQDFDRSIGLDPNHALAHANRGTVHAYLACSDWEKACRLGNCQHLEEAVQIGLCIKMNENGNRSQ
jgi:tetratricopeptide (TPR) repeat protein